MIIKSSFAVPAKIGVKSNIIPASRLPPSMYGARAPYFERKSSEKAPPIITVAKKPIEPAAIE